MSIISIEIIYDILGYKTNKDPRMIRNIETSDRDTLYKFVADQILEVSQRLVPVDTGFLKSTGKVVKNSIGTYSVVYTAPYAVYVHEIIDNRHKFPTQAKFLEDAAWTVLSSFSYYIPFTFTMDTGYGDTLALHIDSLTVDEFKSNLLKMWKNYQIIESGDFSKLDEIDTDFIEVKEAIHYDIN